MFPSLGASGADGRGCSGHVRMVRVPFMDFEKHTTNLDCLNKDETENNKDWSTAWRGCRLSGFVVLTCLDALNSHF